MSTLRRPCKCVLETRFLENASSRFYTVADVHNHAHGLRCRLTRFSRHAIGVPLYTVSIYNRQAVRG